MEKRILALILSITVLSSIFVMNLGVYADEQGKDFVEITEKSAKWTDIDNYLAEVLIKVQGSQVIEPIDVVVCLDKSGSMDMDYLGTDGSPNASCPCLNQDHFYLDKKRAWNSSGMYYPEPSFDTSEYSKDDIVFDAQAKTLSMYDGDTDAWVVLDTTNEKRRYASFEGEGVFRDWYAYHFKKDTDGNYERISKWNTTAEVPFWDHADPQDGCYDRWSEAKAAVKEFTKSVVASNVNNTVALVPFSMRDVKREFYVGWTRDTDLIDSRIDSLVTTGNTDYVYALNMAYNLLDTRTDVQKTTNKPVVLFLSDGKPYPNGSSIHDKETNTIITFSNLPVYVLDAASAITGDENWRPDPAKRFWMTPSGLAPKMHDIDRFTVADGGAANVIGMDATLIAVSYMVPSKDSAVMQEMVSSPELFYNLNADQSGTSSGLLTETLLGMTLAPAGRNTVLSDKISEYFIVDESRLSDKLQCITDPDTGEQTVIYVIGDIYTEEITITIPLILKEAYRGDQQLTYYPTNDDTDTPGALIDYIDPFDKERTDDHETPKLPYEKGSPEITIPTYKLGWMRSIESADTAFIVARNVGGDAWNYNNALTRTPIKYFENTDVYDKAVEQKSQDNEWISNDEPLFGNNHIWDAGTYFDKYKEENGNVSYSWASWQHWGIADEANPEYSIRRFSAYVDIKPEDYDRIETALLAPTDELGNMSYLFPLNDSVYVFINGTLVYWGGTDVVEGNNQFGSGYRTDFDGVQGIQLRNGVNGIFKDIYPHTDGWCIDLEANRDKMNIKSLLKPGFNRIDIFADEYWEGGGMNKVDLFVEGK